MGWLVHTYGWQSVFYVMGALAFEALDVVHHEQIAEDRHKGVGADEYQRAGERTGRLQQGAGAGARCGAPGSAGGRTERRLNAWSAFAASHGKIAVFPTRRPWML